MLKSFDLIPNRDNTRNRGVKVDCVTFGIFGPSVLSHCGLKLCMNISLPNLLS